MSGVWLRMRLARSRYLSGAVDVDWAPSGSEIDDRTRPMRAPTITEARRGARRVGFKCMAPKLTVEAGDAVRVSGDERRTGRGVQKLHRLETVRFANDEPDRVKPLEPWHHSTRVVTYQARVDAVRI